MKVYDLYRSYVNKAVFRYFCEYFFNPSRDGALDFPLSDGGALETLSYLGSWGSWRETEKCLKAREQIITKVF